MKLSCEELSESRSLPFLRCLSSLSTPDVTLRVHKKGTLHTTDVLNAGWIRTPVPPLHARNGDWLQRKVGWWRRALELPAALVADARQIFFSFSPLRRLLLCFLPFWTSLKISTMNNVVFLGKAQMIMTLGSAVGSLLTYSKVSGISKR